MVVRRLGGQRICGTAARETKAQARPFVAHGLVGVNGKRMNIPSYLAKSGDEIEMKESGLQIPEVLELTHANAAEGLSPAGAVVI